MRYILKIVTMFPPRYITMCEKQARKYRHYSRTRRYWELTDIEENATAFRYRRAHRFIKALAGKTQHVIEVQNVPKGWKQRQFSEEASESMLQSSSEGSQPERVAGDILASFLRFKEQIKPYIKWWK